MVRFGKATDYALLALMYLVEQEEQVASARQIAQALSLPAPLLGKILKSLHQNGLLQSTRGSKGGYRIAVDLRDISLDRLLRSLRVDSSGSDRPTDAPLLAFQSKLSQVLREVKLSDLVIPGRRIDVPADAIRIRRKPSPALVQ